ncbi:MAG: polymer-forming cytoskeletal protein [Rhodospirillales bacterium]|nr:polymer-forming cytoskeletal protein [Rhodospirillales bacterium]
MFRRNKDEEGPNVKTPKQDEANDGHDAPPLKPFSKKGSHSPASPASSSGLGPSAPRRQADIPSSVRRLERSRPGDVESKKLIVGRDIRLSGEITACDKLVVEGHVEVMLSDARVIEVAPSGYFKGNATVEEADISGRFDGELIARDKLTVRTGGRISGSIRYGNIVIESGGEISGDMQSLTDDVEPDAAD